MKLKFKLLQDYIIYGIYNLAMLLIAFVFDRFFQMLMFILFFETLQNCFKYRFHADTIQENPIKAVKLCKIITFIVEITYLIFCKNLDTTIYSNLFIIFCIAFVNCILEFTLEKLIEKYCTLNNKEYLLELCAKANLSKLQTDRLVMRYIERKTIKEIANIECVNEDSIKKALSRSKKELFKEH